MRRFPRNSLVVGAAMVCAAALTARAELNPDWSFGALEINPYNSQSYNFGDSLYINPETWYAVQGLDCGNSGTATPQPFSRPGLSLQYTWNDWTFELDYGADRAAQGPVQQRYDPWWDSIPWRPDGPASVFDLGPPKTGDFDSYIDPNLFLLLPPGDFGAGVFPGTGSNYSDVGADQDPIKGLVEPGSDIANDTFSAFINNVPDAAWVAVNYGSFNAQAARSGVGSQSSGLPPEISGFIDSINDIDGTEFITLSFNEQHTGDVLVALRLAGYRNIEVNSCRSPLIPTDPNYQRTGRHGGNSWGEKEDDQWAIKRVGFTDEDSSAWNLLPDAAAPVVVAVVDSGLDWHHLDISPGNVWRNRDEVPDNGIDDDNNGYVDDVIGWNFMSNDSRPWDFDGHGTVVAGIIAAAHNDAGIAGINPNVQIMVLQAINNLGTTRASYIAEAVVYAVDNGARIINLSVGGPHTSRIEQAALAYAKKKGVLVIAAAGNDGVVLDDFGPGGDDNVLTIGATHVDDRTAAFSNYGDKVDLVAPGVDVLSLRARYTDANYRPGTEGNEAYAVGDNYVGDDKRYLHVSGTSFSTPIVAGVASLLLSKNPELTATQVEQILLQTATDIEKPGRDQYTGHGMVDARAALSVAPDFSVTAEITALELFPSDAPQYVRVRGTIDASDFKRAWMQIGPGENPGGWRFVGQKRKYPIVNGEIGTIPLRSFNSSGLWQVVVNVEHKNGVVKRTAFPITVD